MRGGKPLATSYKTKDAIVYQREFIKVVQTEAIKQGWEISSNPYQHYYMDCVFYFDRIDCDANNYFKCLADAITMSNVVWIDDNQLCERVQGIFYDRNDPRIEITITPVDYVGIFPDVAQLQKFESNCIGCTRYKRNCSLLVNAKQGRIQPEINEMICSDFKPYKDKKENKKDV